MSMVPTRPKRPVVLGSLAATALLGVGALTAATGLAHNADPAPADTAGRVSFGLAASSMERTVRLATSGTDRPVRLATSGTDRTAARNDRETGPGKSGKSLEAVLRNTAGRSVGWIRFTAVSGKGHATGTGLVVQVHATGLAPGFHGIHIHSIGVCDPAGATPFASAGPHLNPTHTAEGMQAGALPVLLANRDGTADLQLIDANITLADLTGPTGTSVVVHAGPDNYANIPLRYASNGAAGPDTQTQLTGDAGARVACAVLARPAAATPTVAPTPTHSTVPTPIPTPAAGMPRTTPSAPPTTTTATPTPTVLYGHHW